MLFLKFQAIWLNIYFNSDYQTYISYILLKLQVLERQSYPVSSGVPEGGGMWV